ISAILYPNSNLTIEQCRKVAEAMQPRDRDALLQEYLGRRQNRREKPGRALENTSYLFDFLADYGMFRDLHRHRMLTQERQTLTTDYGYVTPEELVEAGLTDPYDGAMEGARAAYKEIHSEFPLESQYVIPLAYRIRWYMRMNLREVFHMCELRTSVQGHKNYRRLVQRTFKLVESVHPRLAKQMRFVDMQDYELERLDAERRLDRKIEQLRQRDAPAKPAEKKIEPATTAQPMVTKVISQ
ncbi:FAD-dependent thymidylate synthase, partial [Candidatus Micrarchaeota archaeon]|nr:FAD-dependent thymidylate synthase [Candidatus Micrarchaeota archaeon]